MRLRLLAAVTLSIALGSSVARAADPPPPAPAAPTATPRRDPTPGDLGTARSALREGLALREKGDAAAALPRLATAWDLVQTPVTGFELAKTHMVLGHVLQAKELFMKVVRMPLSLEESPRSAAARDESARLAKELEPRIPQLRLKVTLPPNASAVVRIDDETITLTKNEALRAVDPGPHDVVAKAGDGPEQTIHVDVAESELKDVALTPQWIAPPPASVTGGAGGQVVYVRTTNPLAFVGFGIAAASLVVASVAAVVLVNANRDAAKLCQDNYCPPSNRDRTEGIIAAAAQNRDRVLVDRKFSEYDNRVDGATILLVAAAITTVVGGAVGTIFAMRPVKERVVARVRPVFGPNGVGIAGAF